MQSKQLPTFLFEKKKVTAGYLRTSIPEHISSKMESDNPIYKLGNNQLVDLEVEKGRKVNTRNGLTEFIKKNTRTFKCFFDCETICFGIIFPIYTNLSDLKESLGKRFPVFEKLELKFEVKIVLKDSRGYSHYCDIQFIDDDFFDDIKKGNEDIFIKVTLRNECALKTKMNGQTCEVCHAKLSEKFANNMDDIYPKKYCLKCVSPSTVVREICQVIKPNN